MKQVAGAVLAMLLALQTGLAALGLEPPLDGIATVAISVAIAGVAYLVPAPSQS